LYWFGEVPRGVTGREAEMAADLIRVGVDVIVVTTSELAKEMMGVTSTVPIVMAASVDPVALGVAASLFRICCIYPRQTDRRSTAMQRFGPVIELRTPC
jgi:hypothetical protein